MFSPFFAMSSLQRKADNLSPPDKRNRPFELLSGEGQKKKSKNQHARAHTHIHTEKNWSSSTREICKHTNMTCYTFCTCVLLSQTKLDQDGVHGIHAHSGCAIPVQCFSNFELVKIFQLLPSKNIMSWVDCVMLGLHLMFVFRI